MRLQYDIDGSLEKRFRRYCPELKMRHLYAREALEEWINRREGRDKKLQLEKLVADRDLLRPVLQSLIDSGEIEIGGRHGL
jgi:hypothetical protein